MPNRKHVADEVTEEDRKLAGSDPAADLERGAQREQTPPGERAQHRHGVVIEDFDPNEPDPGQPPRTPI
jgi:hypothetical protein